MLGTASPHKRRGRIPAIAEVDATARKSVAEARGKITKRAYATPQITTAREVLANRFAQLNARRQLGQRRRKSRY